MARNSIFGRIILFSFFLTFLEIYFSTLINQLKYLVNFVVHFDVLIRLQVYAPCCELTECIPEMSWRQTLTSSRVFISQLSECPILPHVEEGSSSDQMCSGILKQ